MPLFVNHHILQWSTLLIGSGHRLLKGLPAFFVGAAADLKGLPGVWSAAKMLASIGPQQLDVLWHHARYSNLDHVILSSPHLYLSHLPLWYQVSMNDIVREGLVSTFFCGLVR